MQKNVKLGFIKSKAYGLCGIVLTAACLFTFVPHAYADEATPTKPITETVAKPTEAAPTTTSAPKEATETVSKKDESATPTKSAFEVTKEDTTITVKNPKVDLKFEENGRGKYNNFKVEYKDIKFPDSMLINEGDKVVFNMPKEVSFRTDFDFDVKGSSNETVGHAQASVQKGTVTTTFNKYFKEHPVNKEISMVFDAKWTEEVTSGKLAKPNFDGTVKEVEIAKEPELDPTTEKFSKWGYQDSADAQTLNWTIRFNLAQAKLENLTLQDRWTATQEFVPNSLELRTVDDAKTWSGDKSAQEYLDSFHVLNNGFDLKLKTLQKLMYINYKTRLKTSVKESHNPINAAWLTANNGEKLADNYRATISLVGGKGEASGDAEIIPTPSPLIPPIPTNVDKPKEEIPKETPKKDEKPKETPKVEEPKPKEDKPKDTPKVEQPKESPKPKEEPKEIPKVNEKSKEDTPKVEKPSPKENPKVEQPKPKEDKPKESPKEDNQKAFTNNKVEDKKQTHKVTLPNTGTESNLMFIVLGAICFILGIKIKRTEN